MFRVRGLSLRNFRNVLEALGYDYSEENGSQSSPYEARCNIFQRAAGRMHHTLDQVIGIERSYVAPNRLYNIYGEKLSDETLEFRWCATDEAVAQELHLTGKQSNAELKRLRRAFAWRNHPDRAPPKWRAIATQRMTIANALIDKALKGK